MSTNTTEKVMETLSAKELTETQTIAKRLIEILKLHSADDQTLINEGNSAERRMNHVRYAEKIRKLFEGRVYE